MAKKGPGAPRKELDYKVFDALMQYKATTLAFAADYMNLSEMTITTRLKEDKGLSFEKYHELKMGRISNKLQEKAIQMALQGDRTLLIFCLKNYSKWQDKVDIDVTHQVGNFADWAQKAAENYEKRKRQKQIARTEKRRARIKDVN